MVAAEGDLDVDDGDGMEAAVGEEGGDGGEEGGRVGEVESGEGVVLEVTEKESGLGEWVEGGVRGVCHDGMGR